MAQAERLALARFGNYQAGTGGFRATVPLDSGDLMLHGVVDWRRHLGSGVLRTRGRTDPDANGLLQWTFSDVAFHPGGAVDGDPPPPPADGRWSDRPAQPDASDLDAVLVLILNLALDRPENPEILRDGEARFLRRDAVEGDPVDVYSGPAPAGKVRPAQARTRYWIDDDGRLRRFEARIGAGDRFAVVDVDTSRPGTLVPLPGLDQGGPGEP